ncbi:MAG: hypothetical protein BGO95_01875 [Micrococcales bacterium 73-13]|nr:MAG: hypothetical protein BGO95_01875 [Micrococcales bacterium 73-13]
MTPSSLNPLQQQAIEALKQQQDAYLAAVRAWKKAGGEQFDFSSGMPNLGAMPSFESVPTAEELAASNQLFLTRVFEEQRRFLESLGDILGRS